MNLDLLFNNSTSTSTLLKRSREADRNIEDTYMLELGYKEKYSLQKISARFQTLRFTITFCLPILLVYWIK